MSILASFRCSETSTKKAGCCTRHAPEIDCASICFVAIRSLSLGVAMVSLICRKPEDEADAAVVCDVTFNSIIHARLNFCELDRFEKRRCSDVECSACSTSPTRGR